MAKLKLGTLLDDKPIKLTIDLPANVHRDLIAYAEALAHETPNDWRPGEACGSDAGAFHGDRPRLQGAPQASTACLR